jgi:hypothetical protein
MSSRPRLWFPAVGEASYIHLTCFRTLGYIEAIHWAIVVLIFTLALTGCLSTVIVGRCIAGIGFFDAVELFMKMNTDDVIRVHPVNIGRSTFGQLKLTLPAAYDLRVFVAKNW